MACGADLYHARELADTQEREKVKRKRRRLTLAAVTETAEIHDEVFQRILGVCCEESPIDVREHAAFATREIYKARATRRFPPWREQPDFTEGVA